MAETSRLLQEYIDLRNQEGPGSAAETKFLKEHAGDAELMKLTKAARQLSTMYSRGDLKK